MSPADEAFDPQTATDEQLTLFLARQGVSPIDVERARERAMRLVQHVRHMLLPDERAWEEFELLRIEP